MNKNVKNYVQSNIKCIDEICKFKKKFELAIKVLTLLVVIALLGISTVTYLQGGSIIGYLTYATAFIIGGGMLHKESSDIRKNYEKEKEKLLDLQNRENLLFDEDYITKTKAIYKHKSSIVEKEKKYKSLKSKEDIIRWGVIVSSILSFTYPSFIYITGAVIALYTAVGIYKAKKNADLAKENSELNSLQREIKINEIIQESKEESVKEEVKMKDEVSVLGGVTIEVVATPKSEEERLAEKIVEELEKYPSQEEEKNKINIKK